MAPLVYIQINPYKIEREVVKIKGSDVAVVDPAVAP
jgi:hypothetical protein